LAYIDGRADPDADAILLDTHSAATRQYTGALPMTTVDGSAEETPITLALASATEGRRRIWYITFPDTVGDVHGTIHEYLESEADLVERASFPGVVVEGYQLHSDAAFVPPTPIVHSSVGLGDDIRLLGYDLFRNELSRTQALALTLYWQTTEPVETSYTVFTHLVGPDGQIWGQRDSVPLGGARPTTTWMPGEVIVDRFEVPMNAEAPPGDYTVAVGMYDLATMTRLPVLDARGAWLSEDRILIGELELSANDQ
jgi:hypothetical protein